MFYFFKQKTSYEVRISDWSSDVCSSDLVSSGGEFTAEDIYAMLAAQKKKCWYCGTKLTAYHVDHRIPLARGGSNGPENLVIACHACNLSKGAKLPWVTANRSDEHTSELQSLMSNSYDVYCLTKQNN